MSAASWVSRCSACATWALSSVSSAWFLLTWLASAANASGSGLDGPALLLGWGAGAGAGPGAGLVDGPGVGLVDGGAVVVVVDVVVVVGVSCAYPAAAGTSDAVTNAPRITARARGMSLYRRQEAHC